MISISLCMIVKNEEDVLQRILSCAKRFCDEIIIVDTGSTDTTMDIARKYTDKIYEFEWVDSFAKARNFSFSKATKDYILFLDADDIIDDKNIGEIIKLKSKLESTYDVVTMKYITATDEYGNPTFSFKRHRLVKRSRNFLWYGNVHEYLAVNGKVLDTEISIIHKPTSINKKDSNRNIKIYEKMIKEEVEFTPRDLFYYANELKDHKRYQEAIDKYVAFLVTREGWIEDNIRACIYMANCYQILEQYEKEIDCLLQSLSFDIPRPEVSCRLGDLYKKRLQYQKAIVWYKIALEKEAENNMGFQLKDYSTWYPHLQLCVCYWHIGDKEHSEYHNQKAKEFRPNDKRILSNEQLFMRK
ncbi:glycosyltransferase [Oceanobacillus kimchii]|uniref:glycosyltransferase n=1 Tax=Oceanobacillus kimchii TaxID=746691 RepID=UPI003B014C2C